MENFRGRTPTHSYPSIVRGTVLGPDGAPAAGAIVWAALVDSSRPLVVRETTTDGLGRFALEVEPGPWGVWARKGTLGGEIGRNRPPIDPSLDPAPIMIRMREEGILRVVLREEETGRPIAGARFVLDVGLILTADDEGRFEVEGLSLGRHEARVIAPGRVRMRVLFDTTLRPRAELELHIPRGGKIVGRVTDEYGWPIPGAFVGGGISGNVFTCSALKEWTDGEGRFVRDGVVIDGATRLAAEAPGYRRQRWDGLRFGAEATPLQVNFRLERDSAVIGTGCDPRAPADQVAARHRDVIGIICAADGRPIVDALVTWGVRNGTETPATRTDADGRFRLVQVPDVTDFLGVFSPGSGLAPAFPEVDPGGDMDLEVTLAQGSTARGTIRDPAGTPLVGVLVTPHIAAPDGNTCERVWLEPCETLTDDEGCFVLVGLPKGRVLFDFLGRGLTDLRNRTLRRGGAENEITMQPNGAIRGRVVDREGAPVRTFRVLIGIPRKPCREEKAGGYFLSYAEKGLPFTSEDGSFVVGGLEAGESYRVLALAVGHGAAVGDRVPAHPVNRLPPAEALTLRLVAPYLLRVRIVTKGRRPEPIVDAVVTLVNGDTRLDKCDEVGSEEMVHARSDGQGWAEFPALGFGEATLLVQAPGYGRTRQGWRGGERALIVALSPEAVVAGAIRNTSGQPLSEIEVHLLKKTGDRTHRLVPIGPADEGHFRVGELLRGTYLLWLQSASGDLLHDEEITLESGQELIREIRVER